MWPRLWEVWRVDWIQGFDSKRRRAVCVRYQQDRTPVFALISTKDSPDRPRVLLRTTDPEFAATGLDEDCYLYVPREQGVEDRHLHGKAGEFGPRYRERAQAAIDLYLKETRGR